MGLSIDICFATRAEVEGRIWWERNESAIDVVVRATGDKERVFLYKNNKTIPMLAVPVKFIGGRDRALYEVVQFLHSTFPLNIDRTLRIVLHCNSSVHRAPCLAVALACSCLEMDGRTALETICNHRPAVWKGYHEMLAQRNCIGRDRKGKDVATLAAMMWAMGQHSVSASIVMNKSVCSLQCPPVEKADSSSRADVYTSVVVEHRDRCESVAEKAHSVRGADVYTDDIMQNKYERVPQGNQYDSCSNISITESLENKQPEKLESYNPAWSCDASVSLFTPHYHAHWALYDFDGIKFGPEYLSFPKHALLFVPPQESCQGCKYGMILNPDRKGWFPETFTEVVASPPLIQITQNVKPQIYITCADGHVYGAMMSGVANAASQVSNI